LTQRCYSDLSDWRAGFLRKAQ